MMYPVASLTNVDAICHTGGSCSSKSADIVIFRDVTTFILV